VLIERTGPQWPRINESKLNCRNLVFSEVISLNSEDLPIIQVVLRGFQNIVRKAHIHQGVGDLFVPVGLTQFEEAPSNGRRMLGGSNESHVRHSQKLPGNSPSFHHSSATRGLRNGVRKDTLKGLFIGNNMQGQLFIGDFG
jgi:hypothetical protein